MNGSASYSEGKRTAKELLFESIFCFPGFSRVLEEFHGKTYGKNGAVGTFQTERSQSSTEERKEFGSKL
ncbi:MAG: hypothetical protein QW260_06150 [Thermoproteota archaeon]